MSRHRHTPSGSRTAGRFWRQMRRMNERRDAGIEIAKGCLWFIAGVVFIAGCAPTLSCSPERGDSSARVIAECGQPLGRAEMRTGYGTRQEFEYADMLVVIDDGEVLTVVREVQL